MSLFSSPKKKKLKLRDNLCHDIDIFIQVHYVRERNAERYKFYSLTLKDDPDWTACKEWYENHGNPESFSEVALIYLEEKKRDEKTVSEKYQLGNNFFSNLRNNKTYHPSKGEAVCTCMAFHLNYESARALLKTAGYAFSNSVKSDLIIRYFLENHIFNISDLNYVLEHFEQPKVQEL